MITAEITGREEFVVDIDGTIYEGSWTFEWEKDKDGNLTKPTSTIHIHLQLIDEIFTREKSNGEVITEIKDVDEEKQMEVAFLAAEALNKNPHDSAVFKVLCCEKGVIEK